MDDERVVRVLIADDDAVMRTLLERLIENQPSLELAGSAAGVKEAVELADLHKPDVAVLDWVMPGGGGSQAARDIEACSPSTRIVALTAHDTPEASYDMARSGARAFVLKGSPSERIVDAIHSSLRY